jgi:F0F1-type ATP synthase epsilon subunit
MISIQSGSNTTEYLIAGGFAEITPGSVSILAEYAANRDEADREAFEAQLAAITAKIEATEGLRKAEAERDSHEVKHMLDNLVPK